MAKFERVVLPFGEWAPDESYLSTTGNLERATNLIRLDGSYSRVPVPATIASATPGAAIAPKAAISWSDETGENRVAVAFGGHLYALDIAGGTLTDRCKGGHYSDQLWDFVKFGPSVVATNNTEPVQLFNFGAASADLFTSTTKPRGKYLCACRGHLILANISAPAANVRQFRWSALNSAADMEPGSNRSGFAELAGDAGVITGAQGFEDFFLLFTTVGVYRASYIGGADVWSLQQVGGWHDGMPEAFHESLVPVGRDCFYFGRSGPKVVVNGEAVKDLSLQKSRRFLMDDNRGNGDGILDGSVDTTIPYGSLAWGCYDGFRQLVYWGFGADKLAQRVLVLYAYSIADDALSLLLPDIFNMADSAQFGALFARPGNLRMVGAGSPPGRGLCFCVTYKTPTFLVDTIAAKGLTGSTFLAGEFWTKTWRPSAAKTQIHAIRPLWRSLDGKTLDIVITVNGVVFASIVNGVSTSIDGRGFFALSHSGGGTAPYGSDEFVFLVQISDPASNPGAQLKDFLGLELEVTSEKSST